MRQTRSWTSVALTLLALGAGITVGKVAAQQAGTPAAAADCTLNPAASRSPRELWHRISLEAEALAPSPDAVQSARRRAVGHPKSLFPSRNFIDNEIFNRMLKDGVRWTAASSDEEFLRRVSLDLTGQIPTIAKVKSFLADTSTGKRDKLIDDLLSSEEFVDRWALWFGDHVQNVRVSSNINMYVQGRNAYYTYIRDSMRAARPYDQMVRDVLSTNGASFTVGPANYWVRQILNNGPPQDTYDNLSADSGEKFLGLPLNCVSCHRGLGHLEQVNTSLVLRTREDFWKNAAFFAQTAARPQRDSVNNTVEYILSDNLPGEYRLNTTSGNKTPRAPATGQPNVVAPAFFLNGEGPKSGEPRRAAYARILTAHPQFARATVNYIWKEVFGIGIVEPADSFDLQRQDPATLVDGATLQPTHPQLLTQLADQFTASGYNLRALLKTIVTSNAYQLSSRYTPGPWNETWVTYYARHYPRRILAESVSDAIARSTNVAIPYNVQGLTIVRAMQLPDPTDPNARNATGLFINSFGRGDRDTTPRSREGSIVQALVMLNDAIVTTRVKAANNSTVATVLQGSRDTAVVADELYIATLSRHPSAQERAAAIAYLNSGDLTRKAEDLQFALLNRLEFLYN